MIADADSRLRVLDTTRSYIVQAPAGSGKTQLLVSRYICLLANVAEPEEILALTFTRKAAAEMRQRVVELLESHDIPEYLHDLIAPIEVIRAREKQWQLSSSKHRLRIMTIDAFCARLTHEAPLLTQAFALQPVTNIQPLFEQAFAQTCATGDARIDAVLHELVIRYQGKLSRFQQAMLRLVEKREQWLELLVFINSSQDTEVYTLLEQSRLTVIHAMVQQAGLQIPEHVQSLLVSIARRIQRSLQDAQLAGEKYNLQYQQLTQQLLANVGELQTQQQGLFWHAVIQLWSTNTGSWRVARGLNRNYGVNPQDIELKADTKTVADFFAENIEIAIIEQWNNAPITPVTEEESQAIHHIAALAIHLTAQLQLQFYQHQQCDYQQLMHFAQQLIGTAAAPGILADRLWSTINHILVDEFQDTSISQFKLLEQLVSLWQDTPANNNTVFFVGDPMQSIYRFRQAEVKLFRQVQRQGIAGIEVISLQLSANFRSQPRLVTWFNAAFTQAFSKAISAQKNDDSTITYIPSQAAVKQIGAKTAEVTWVDEQTPAYPKQILEHLQTCQHDPTLQSIAVLVRSRKHAAPLLEVLQQQHIAFSAVEFTSLADLPHIIELRNALAALQYLDDDLAWAGIVRSPSFAVAAQTLVLVFEHTDAATTGYFRFKTVVENPDVRSFFDEQEWLQLQQFVAICAPFVAARSRVSWQSILIDVWNVLFKQHYPSTAQADVETYIAVSYECMRSNCIDHIELDKKIALFRQSSAAGDIEVMTIHKAKGLEFDAVFILGMDQIQRNSDNPILLWQQTQAGLLAAAQQRLGVNSIYDYLRWSDRNAQHDENIRMLYVALTRAKKRLYLVGNYANAGIDKIPKNSFLSLLAEVYCAAQPICQIGDADIDPQVAIAAPSNAIARNLAPQLYASLHAKYASSPQRYVSQPRQTLEQQVGVVFHSVVEYVCTQSSGTPFSEVWDSYWPRLQRLYTWEYFDAAVYIEVERNWQSMIDDFCGRWLLMRQAQDHHEWELSGAIDGSIKTLRLDRCFVGTHPQQQQDKLWIIDYKTSSRPQHTALSVWQDAMRARYSEQLAQYAALLKNHPLGQQYELAMALYVPMEKSLIELQQ